LYRDLSAPQKGRWVARMALTAGLVVWLAACSAAPPATLEGAVRVTATPSLTIALTEAPRPSPTRVSTTRPSKAIPTRTLPATTPTGRPTVTPTPAAALPQHLVMARDTSILYGGLRGEDVQQIAELELAEVWAFQRGRLALAQGSLVQMVDLVGGTDWSRRLDQDGMVDTDILWGSEGRFLLHIAVVESDEGHRSTLRVLDAETGSILGARALEDGTVPSALRYDDADDRVFLAMQGEAGELVEVSVVYVLGEKEAASYPVAGRLPGSLDREGEQFAYVSRDAKAVCLQELGPETPRRCVTLPLGQLPTSYAWSNDGDMLAIMLQANPAATIAQPQDAGLWTLSKADLTLRQVLAHEGSMSAVMNWSPDDDMILARHSGGSIPDHVYLIRPDGGDRRIVPSSERMLPLGWMPTRRPDARELELDPWPMRFAAYGQNAQGLANVTARWLALIEPDSDDQLSERLQEYVRASGWQPDLAGPEVVHVDEGLYVVYLPPQAIYVCEGGSAYAIASGQLIQAVGYQGDRLALIHATIGASSVSPAFVLAERDAESWRVAWTPQGQRYWIATDGEIGFASEGLDRLTVRGSSFGLEPAPGDAFRECHACVHRWLQAEWVRAGDGYGLANEEIVTMPRDDALWALTERTPYAVLHETLRRLRLDESVSDLADAKAVEQAVALGLMEPGRLFVGEEETAETVVFSDLASGARYVAEVRQGRLTSIARAAD